MCHFNIHYQVALLRVYTPTSSSMSDSAGPSGTAVLLECHSSALVLFLHISKRHLHFLFDGLPFSCWIVGLFLFRRSSLYFNEISSCLVRSKSFLPLCFSFIFFLG